jgi:hypothetical protein
MSVKAVEAFGHVAAIISTRIGVRGLPVIDGKHCLIDDQLELWPDVIASLLERPAKLLDLRNAALELGARYDYKVVFEAYDIPSDPDWTRSVAEEAAPDFTELLPRFQAGGGTAEGLQWLLGKISTTTLDLEKLTALANLLQRLLPSDPRSHTVMDAIRHHQPRSLDDLLRNGLR